jgi:hypothetical protein
MQSVALLPQITQQIAFEGLQDDAVVLLKERLNKDAHEMIDFLLL